MDNLLGSAFISACSKTSTCLGSINRINSALIYINNFKNPFENLKTSLAVIEKYNSAIIPLVEYLNSIRLELYSVKTLSEEENEVIHKVINDISQTKDFSLDKDLKYIENTIYNSIENVAKTLDNSKSVSKSFLIIYIILELIKILPSFFSNSLINIENFSYNKIDNTYNIENINIID